MTRKILFIVVVIEALTFFIGALLHSGMEVSIVKEPKIIPAMIVEGLCGIFLTLSAYEIIRQKKQAWNMTVSAHIFSIAGVLLGITSLAMGHGPTTELNYFYHRIILAILIIVLFSLYFSPVKSAFRFSAKSTNS